MNQEEAWQLAARVRKEKMDLRARIKGAASFEDGVALAIASLGEPCIKNLALERYLLWIPRVGPRNVAKKLRRLGWADTQKLVGHLSAEQAQALAAELARGTGW